MTALQILLVCEIILATCFMVVLHLNLKLVKTLRVASQCLSDASEEIFHLNRENEKYLRELTARREAAFNDQTGSVGNTQS